jgi:hypothetical protein
MFRHLCAGTRTHNPIGYILAPLQQQPSKRRAVSMLYVAMSGHSELAGFFSRHRKSTNEGKQDNELGSH